MTTPSSITIRVTAESIYTQYSAARGHQASMLAGLVSMLVHSHGRPPVDSLSRSGKLLARSSGNTNSHTGGGVPPSLHSVAWLAAGLIVTEKSRMRKDASRSMMI